jgi:glycerol dehydrogenase-like iron-containing ADH family enzyme
MRLGAEHHIHRGICGFFHEEQIKILHGLGKEKGGKLVTFATSRYGSLVHERVAEISKRGRMVVRIH